MLCKRSWPAVLSATCLLGASCASPPATPAGGQQVLHFQYDAKVLPGVLGNREGDAVKALRQGFERSGFEVLSLDQEGWPTRTVEVCVALAFQEPPHGPREVTGLALWAPPQGTDPADLRALEDRLARELDRRRSAGEVLSPLTDVSGWVPLPGSKETTGAWLPLDPIEAGRQRDRGEGATAMDPRFVPVAVPRDAGKWWTGPVFQHLALSADMNGLPALEFVMTPESAARFRSLTGSLLGQPLYVAVDGRIISAPRVQSAIPGRGLVSGGPQGLDPKDCAAILAAVAGRRAPAAEALMAVDRER